VDSEIPSGILITDSRVQPDQLRALVDRYFGYMVELVVDVQRRVGGKLHADAEACFSIKAAVTRISGGPTTIRDSDHPNASSSRRS
jgi:hypothetical protein